MKSIKTSMIDDPNSANRKRDHIELAFASKTSSGELDYRFYYEPALATFPDDDSEIVQSFVGKKLKYPIWISSMTGGTAMARKINRNLARVCQEFGLGMGLGSCRKLLYSDQYFEDFAVRPYIGEQPLYANLGIAQVIDLIQQDDIHVVDHMMTKLEADGLIIHINPIQEWLQPEGDQIRHFSPIEAIKIFIEHLNYPILVKEVGQGFGPESLRALLSLPIAALEFGGFGGTNFAKLEAMRKQSIDILDPICYVGHTPEQMIGFIKNIGEEIDIKCRSFIISGGVKNYLDGYYFNELLPYNSVYGQAAGFLKYALQDYESLREHVSKQTRGYLFAQKYLKVKI